MKKLIWKKVSLDGEWTPLHYAKIKETGWEFCIDQVGSNDDLYEIYISYDLVYDSLLTKERFKSLEDAKKYCVTWVKKTLDSLSKYC